MWREYTIRVQSGECDGFYAPSLEDAFALARARWPHATAWECVTSKRV